MARQELGPRLPYWTDPLGSKVAWWGIDLLISEELWLQIPTRGYKQQERIVCGPASSLPNGRVLSVVRETADIAI